MNASPRPIDRGAQRVGLHRGMFAAKWRRGAARCDQLANSR